MSLTHDAMRDVKPAPAGEIVDTVRLQQIAQAYWQSAALMAAIELRVFTVIESGKKKLPEIADATGISQTNANRLLTVLVAMNLLSMRGDDYANAPDAARFLVEGGRSYAGPWMLFSKPDWNRWGKLSDALRSSEQKVLGEYETFTIEDARRYHAATYSIGLGAGRRFVRQVDLSGRRHLLDIGGGSGCYSIVAAQAHPQLRATVFDLEPVTVVAAEFIAQNGVSDRVKVQAGDFTRDPFPAGVDIAIMASNLPQYSPDLIRLVFAKAFTALVSGGEMHLLGETLRSDRSGPLAPALWGLNEALLHSTGVAHSEGDCIGYLRAAGFVDVEVHEFVPNSLTRIVGRKA